MIENNVGVVCALQVMTRRASTIRPRLPILPVTMECVPQQCEPSTSDCPAWNPLYRADFDQAFRISLYFDYSRVLFCESICLNPINRPTRSSSGACTVKREEFRMACLLHFCGGSCIRTSRFSQRRKSSA